MLVLPRIAAYFTPRHFPPAGRESGMPRVAVCLVCHMPVDRNTPHRGTQPRETGNTQRWVALLRQGKLHHK